MPRPSGQFPARDLPALHPRWRTPLTDSVDRGPTAQDERVHAANRRVSEMADNERRSQQVPPPTAVLVHQAQTHRMHAPLGWVFGPSLRSVSPLQMAYI